MIRRIQRKQQRKRELQDKIEHIHEKLLQAEAEADPKSAFVRLK